MKGHYEDPYLGKNKKIEEAIAAFSADASRETLASVLAAFIEVMEDDGHLLLAVDMSLFSRYRRKHTGIVVDADNGIARYFPERCLRVEVPVYFSHIDVEAVGLVLHEDGIAEQV